MNKIKMINSLKNTVGYNESDNKAEYLKGAGMALDKALLCHELVIGNQSRAIHSLKAELSQIKRVVGQFGNLVKSVLEEAE
jgi:hypothetical protein